MKLYFGFALADSMFSGDCTIHRRTLSPGQAKARLLDASQVISALNPSHLATIDAMRARFGIEVEIPASPPQVAVAEYDSMLVMGVRGLPRLTDRHEYTSEEIAGATFSFAVYTVYPVRYAK